jgi:hypothetical protein
VWIPLEALLEDQMSYDGDPFFCLNLYKEETDDFFKKGESGMQELLLLVVQQDGGPVERTIERLELGFNGHGAKRPLMPSSFKLPIE